MPFTAAVPHQMRQYRAVLDSTGQPKVLGRGAYGTVYEFVDTVVQEHVAIKRINLSDIPPREAISMVKHAERELTVHYSLNHPHLVKLRDIFVEHGCLNLVMELVEGGCLLPFVNNLIRQSRSGVPEPVARWLFQQLVFTLDYLHAKGVSHRDIKLDNTLLQTNNIPLMPLIKVADFGLSRFGTHADTLVGTAQYQAPEIVRLQLYRSQNDGHDLHRNLSESSSYMAQAADLWSAGVMLYAMVVGRYPFPINLPLEQRITAMNTWPHQLPDHLTADCQNLLQRLLQPDATMRITTEELKAHPWVQHNLPHAAASMTANFLDKKSPCSDNVSQQQLDGIIATVKSQLLGGLNGDGTEQHQQSSTGPAQTPLEHDSVDSGMSHATSSEAPGRQDPRCLNMLQSMRG